MSVVETLHQLRGGSYVLEPPKSKSGRRFVAMSPSLALLLRKHKTEQERARRLIGLEFVPDDLVFPFPDGKSMCPDAVTKAFNVIARSLGLNHLRLHDLRHSHATLMLAQGVHPKIVSERLGHSSIGITLDTYSHVLPGLQEAAALRFDEGLQPQSAELPVEVEVSRN